MRSAKIEKCTATRIVQASDKAERLTADQFFEQSFLISVKRRMKPPMYRGDRQKAANDQTGFADSYSPTMEAIMVGHEHQQSHYSVVFDAVADWVRRYRAALKRHNELAAIDADQVAAIAKDIGIPASQLQEFASKGERAVKSLRKLLVALGVDPKEFDKIDVRVMRDMQWLCVTCSNKDRCNHDLSTGIAEETFRKFCPNAKTLDAIFDLKAKDTTATKDRPLKYY